MPSVSVTCRCLHPLRQEPGAPNGYLVCRNCGTRIRINMDRSRVCSASNPNGSPCIAELFMFDPVPLCKTHRDQLLLDPAFTGGELYTKTHVEKVRADAMTTRFPHTVSDEDRAAMVDAETAERRARDLRSQVYYVALRGHIKIGFTSNITVRMTQLLPDALLATEPGDRKLETKRHRQFSHLRGTFGMEYFKVDPELVAHVETVLAEHGPPSLTYYPNYEAWRRQTAA